MHFAKSPNIYATKKEKPMLDRTDRSLVGVWWWTVDKWLLASAVMLMVIGTLLVMAAGPAVAI